jgi:hypothetical protein
LEVNTCIEIYLLCRSEIQLINRNVMAALISDIKCGARQDVVMDLLRRAAVFEDERDCILALRGGKRMRLFSGCLVWIGRRGLARVGWLRLVRFGVVRLGCGIIVTGGVGVSKETRAYPPVPNRNSEANSRTITIRWSVGPSIRVGRGVSRTSYVVGGDISPKARAHVHRSASNVSRSASEVVGSGGGEPSAKRGCGVAGKTSARGGTLGADRNSKASYQQREYGQALH